MAPAMNTDSPTATVARDNVVDRFILNATDLAQLLLIEAAAKPAEARLKGCHAAYSRPRNPWCAVELPLSMKSGTVTYGKPWNPV